MNLWFSSCQSSNRKCPTIRSDIFYGWTGRIRTCECWDQNPVPYRLATVQYKKYSITSIKKRKDTPNYSSHDIIKRMIKIIAGGKKHPNWLVEATSEYDKRLHKPWNMEWIFMEEEKLNSYLENWPFTGNDFVIIADERGKNISSPEFAHLIDDQFIHSKNIIIIIGGAYGFSENTREKANFLWSFSKLVFPHQIARLIVAEQIYRANQILNNTSYHHE